MFDRARYVGEVLSGVLRQELLTRAMSRPSAGGDPQATRARAVRHALEELGPFYIKIGQMLSTRPDIVPDYMREEFENLHAEVSIAPFSDFEPILVADLGPNWRSMFEEIETDKPLGAASLAQVYRVRLRNGREAVMKIQRPGVSTVMREDMALMRSLARIFAKRAKSLNEVLDAEAMLESLFAGMEPELDFTIEARNMNDARKFLERYEHLAVPEVINVTPRVLVQEMAPGTSIADVNANDFSTDERMAIGRDLIAMMIRGMIVDRMFHADPHPGNVFVAPGKPAYLIDWGMCGRLDRRMSLGVVGIFLAVSRNDGEAMAKSWIEIGRATNRANIPAFVNDLSNFVPAIAGASLEELNFGVALTSVLRYSTRRGIQTPPAISLIGKTFANMEGSVRSLAPELGLIDCFKEEFSDIAFDLVKEATAEDSIAKVVIDAMQAMASGPEQTRSVMRDIANREVAVQIRSDRTPLMQDPLVRLLALAGLWRLVRR